MNTLHQPPEQRALRKLAGFLTSAYIDKAAEVTGEADVGELGRDVLPVKTQDIGTVVEFQVAHGSREFLQHVVGVSYGAGLVLDFVVFHPVIDLLVGHVEVALLLVQRGHFGHLLSVSTSTGRGRKEGAWTGKYGSGAGISSCER